MLKDLLLSITCLVFIIIQEKYVFITISSKCEVKIYYNVKNKLKRATPHMATLMPMIKTLVFGFGHQLCRLDFVRNVAVSVEMTGFLCSSTIERRI